ncbi:DUF1501 domain-containing protein [Rhizobium sp. L1K21]|uniref:DUF1501 domain-containing protein n=1 Tax=Rhizobium sp. L1K21 TaxID=2954933 RepID=UPI002093DD86|nr:DUF1501 domain-containing protein [Rhizobium sp. L1K21]MCO6185864.1 DUF1501 domain-containing protein [Rhizobium sp. L1K21]
MTFLHPTRRGLLIGAGMASAGAFAGWTHTPAHSSLSGSRDPRFLQVILRGGMDGLAVAEPTFEPRLEQLRQGILLGNLGEAALPLQGGFVLNPKLKNLHEMYLRGEASIFHAVASPYRGRSHFDGQDFLESGAAGGKALETGWLNRALSVLPQKNGPARDGLAVSLTAPLIMRGKAPVITWRGGGLRALRPESFSRLMELYSADAPGLKSAFESGLTLTKLADEPPSGEGSPFVNGMRMAGQFFSKPEGPRIGMIDLDGWDTHAEEAPEGNNLGKALAELDAGLAALKDALGAHWKDTVVAVATEFGRTVRINGTEGTDHGTATVAFLVGGAVQGGRVIADWPGLQDNNLFESRDLMPTMDIRSILKGVLSDHLGIAEGVLSDVVFPDSQTVKPFSSLLV